MTSQRSGVTFGGEDSQKVEGKRLRSSSGDTSKRSTSFRDVGKSPSSAAANEDPEQPELFYRDTIRRTTASFFDGGHTRRNDRKNTVKGANDLQEAAFRKARTMTMSFAAPEVAVTNATSSSLPVQGARPDKKKVVERAKSPWMEVVDRATETTLEKATEPPCLRTCMEYPSCERIFHPAEHATRYARKDSTTNHAEGGDGAAGPGEKSFRLPDFEQAGYMLADIDEVVWHDKSVPLKLGLRLATHRKTSMQRLCLPAAKSSLPSGVNQEQIKSFLRNLKRCDHVNILTCQEVYEDRENLYFMYEYWPCYTLASVLQGFSWTQEQIVNLVRECCSAVASAASLNLNHLGLTLHHVLLPAAITSGDTRVAKVFGFGLLGLVDLGASSDRLYWAPEVLEKYLQNPGGNFVARVDTGNRVVFDSWSLGAIIYTLVAKTTYVSTEADVLTKKWRFTMAFDEYDPEARSLVEGLMQSDPIHRLKPEKATHHEWIRKRWRPPRHGDEVFRRIVDFSESPLSRRLFGRFIARFLDATHLRQVALRMYELDDKGHGVVTFKDLQARAKATGYNSAAIEAIHGWLSLESGTSYISLARFSEALAEDVVDGQALRNAFESLDEDGSEVVTPDELYEALHAYDQALTVNDVVEYIDAAETKLEGGGNQTAQDTQIEYEEFVQLFPLRARRVRDIQSRVESSRSAGQELSGRFLAISSPTEGWLKEVQNHFQSISSLADSAIQKDGGDNSESLFGLRKHVIKVTECLKNPPGVGDEQASRRTKERKAKARNKSNAEVYGFDSFLQDQAAINFWGSMIADEARALKSLLGSGKSKISGLDTYKCYEAAQSVCKKVQGEWKWSQDQFEEYRAFSDALQAEEACLAAIKFSSRGLRRHGEQQDDDLDGDGEDDRGAPGTIGFLMDFMGVCSVIPFGQREELSR